MALDLKLAGNRMKSEGLLVPLKGFPVARLKFQEQGTMAGSRVTYGVGSTRWTIILEAGKAVIGRWCCYVELMVCGRTDNVLSNCCYHMAYIMIECAQRT